MRVLIVGEGKSGTTALLRSVAAALEGPAESFEPVDLGAVDLRPDTLVVKKLLTNWTDDEASHLDRFDRVVLIVRDPRDRLISHVLYDAYNRAGDLRPGQRDRWLGLLERKIAPAPHIPVVKLLDVWWQMTGADLLGAHIRSMQRINAFYVQYRDRLHLTHYEDYVDGEFDRLSDHLGLRLEPGTVRDSERRVARRSGHGDWRHWFNRTDVTVFRPITAKWLKRFGYDPADWDLATEPSIDAATSLEYVRSLLEAVPPPPDPVSEVSP